MNRNFLKTCIPCLCLTAVIQLQSCSDSNSGISTESTEQKADDIVGSSKRSEGTAVNSEMAHWIGTYRFTDSQMTSNVSYPNSSNATMMMRYPTMELNIFERGFKLVGVLSLTNVVEPRNVNVIINGNSHEIGVHFISSNTINKGVEEKGELLFALHEENDVLTTTWKSWYPLNANESITSGFIKATVK